MSDTAYRLKVKQQNKDISKNQYILSKTVDCIKVWGKSEFVLTGNDEAESSQYPGIFWV